jgi:hypothetical protein
MKTFPEQLRCGEQVTKCVHSRSAVTAVSRSVVWSARFDVPTAANTIIDAV